MEIYTLHEVLAQINIMRNSKLGIYFLLQDTPVRFINNVINDFESKGHESITPSYLLKDFESKPIVLIDVPHCTENEKLCQQILKKLNVFTTEKRDFTIAWKRRMSESFSF